MIIYYSEFEKKTHLNISAKEYRKLQHDKSIDLLKLAAYDIHGIVVTEKDIIRNKYGKPYFNCYPNVFFSISHTEGMSVCIVSEVNCGIDIEKIESFHPKAAKRLFSNAELAYTDCNAEKFCRIWTLKESYSKAVGTGLRSSLKNIEFTVNDNYNVSCSDKQFSFRQCKLDNYIISVCLESPDKSLIPNILLKKIQEK